MPNESQTPELDARWKEALPIALRLQNEERADTTELLDDGERLAQLVVSIHEELNPLLTELQELRKAARAVYDNMVGTCDYGEPKCQEPSFAGFMHGHCNAHAEEFDMPIGAMKDQTLLNELKKALRLP